MSSARYEEDQELQKSYKRRHHSHLNMSFSQSDHNADPRTKISSAYGSTWTSGISIRSRSGLMPTMKSKGESGLP